MKNAAWWQAEAMRAQDRNDFPAAVDAWWQALQLDPANASLYNNFGVLLKNLGDYNTAETCLREALRLQPDLSQAWNNLGNVLRQQERAAEAMTCFDTALTYAPDDVGALLNRGNAALQLLDLNTALSSYEGALQLEPAHVDARWNYALALLVAGRYAAAWPFYEARWQLPEAVYAFDPARQWRGEAVKGMLVLWHEQGFGDTLQMLRAIPVIQAQQADVEIVFAGPESLWPLIRSSFGLRCVDINTAATLPYVAHSPMLSLPGVLGWSLDSLPASIPYLRAGEAAVAAVRAELGSRRRPRVGLVWGSGAWGHGRSDRDRQRKSMPFAQLQPLLQDDGIEWCALQLGSAHDDIPADAPLRDLAPLLQGWEATAACVGELDLVISVDTGVAHLAAAVGCPVYLLLKHDSGNFWLTERTDSPWYPGLRIFRQPAPGDWSSLIAAVVAVLPTRIQQSTNSNGIQ